MINKDEDDEDAEESLYEELCDFQDFEEDDDLDEEQEFVTIIKIGSETSEVDFKDFKVMKMTILRILRLNILFGQWYYSFDNNDFDDRDYNVLMIFLIFSSQPWWPNHYHEYILVKGSGSSGFESEPESAEILNISRWFNNGDDDQTNFILLMPICSRWHYTNDVSKTKKLMLEMRIEKGRDIVKASPERC